MPEFKKIDVSKLNTKSIQKIKFADLLGDAVARKDKDAHDFLHAIVLANQKKKPHSRRRIQTIRSEYLARFLGYGDIPQSPTLKPQSELDRQLQLLNSVAHLFEADTSCAG